MSILALDLATQTGWAHATQDACRQWPRIGELGAKAPKGVTFGTWVLGTTSEVPWPARRGQLAAFLWDKVPKIGPKLIVFEAPVPRMGKLSPEQMRNLHSFAVTVEDIAYEMRLPCYEVPVITVKKDFTGKGRAEKEDIMFRCMQRGWHPENHDEADALALLDVSVTQTNEKLRDRG